MKNISLDQYKKAWVFRHPDVPVSPGDLAAIKPMAKQRALDFWRDNVSGLSDHPGDLSAEDWGGSRDTWLQHGSWQGEWDSEHEALPVMLAEHFNWESNTVVYFCYSENDIIETSWAVFQRCWKNFLFFDDGPLLMGRKRKEVAQFASSGTFKVGLRP